MVVNYYHISESNLDGKTLKPRVPESRMDNEDDRKRRVCFSTSIRGDKSFFSVRPEHLVRFENYQEYCRAVADYKKEHPESKAF